MSRPAPRGWCPSAERPMLSGDGLIMRLRPALGWIEAGAFRHLCGLARRHGNRIIEVTSRASLQLRGVSEAAYPQLLADVAEAGLLPAIPQNGGGITVQPFWRAGDATARLERALAETLTALPPLPAKFGLALDDGDAPVLSDVSADIRIERATDGGLIIRADGAATGCAVPMEQVPGAVADLVRWFLRTGGSDVKRMRRHIATVPLPAARIGAGAAPAQMAGGPGPTSLGPIVGLPFGQGNADAVEALLDARKPAALRLTPWRALLLEGAHDGPETDGFIWRANDPLRRVEACPGAPACATATVATRHLARALAGKLPGRLHVSGCAKGCAWPRDADHVLVGNSGRFDLVQSGTAWDRPVRTGLTADEAAALGGDV
ncbi:MAG: cobalamin biosynthesis protein CobG [Pseudomonadota bacterium]